MKTTLEILAKIESMPSISEDAKKIILEYIDDSLVSIKELEKPVTIYSLLQAKFVCLNLQINQGYFDKISKALGIDELFASLAIDVIEMGFEALQPISQMSIEEFDKLGIDLKKSLQKFNLDEQFLEKCLSGQVTLREFIENKPDLVFFEK